MKANPVSSVVLDSVRESLISSSGALLLREAIRVAGLGRGLSAALAPWRLARAQHDPGKVLLDLATAVALGGDCLADIAAVRAQPAIFGSVASDPTVSRPFAVLAGDVDAAVAAIRGARADARAAVWAFVDHGQHSTGETLAVDLRGGAATELRQSPPAICCRCRPHPHRCSRPAARRGHLPRCSSCFWLHRLARRPSHACRPPASWGPPRCTSSKR